MNASNDKAIVAWLRKKAEAWKSLAVLRLGPDAFLATHDEACAEMCEGIADGIEAGEYKE